MAIGLFLQVDESNLLYSKLSRMGNYGWGDYSTNMDVSHNDEKQRDYLFGIDPFYIKKGSKYKFYFYLI